MNVRRSLYRCVMILGLTVAPALANEERVPMGSDAVPPSSTVHGSPWMGPLITYSTRMSPQERRERAHKRLHIRKINSQITLARAEVAAFRRHVAFYQEHFENTPALLVTRDRAKLSLLASELRLKELRAAKRLLLRTRRHAPKSHTHDVRHSRAVPTDGPVASVQLR